MEDCFKKIKSVISEYINISEEEWQWYSSMLKLKKYKKKEIIYDINSNVNNIFFVNSGILRKFFIDVDGNEKTFHFTMEKGFAGDYDSFINDTPCTYGIQALEDSAVIVMSRELFQMSYKKLEEGEKLGRLLVEDYFIIYSNKLQSIYTKSPSERYSIMNKLFPGILSKVPQHYIASYLNISPVHLSRLINS